MRRVQPRLGYFEWAAIALWLLSCGTSATRGTRPVGGSDEPSGEPSNFSGHVRDSGENPIAGAQICAFRQGPDLTSKDLREVVCVDTQRDGSYRFSGLEAGSYRLHACAAGFMPVVYSHGRGSMRRATVVVSATKELTELDFALQAGAVEVTGHVRSWDGTPIEGALVAGDDCVTRSRSDGQFNLWVRPRGLVEVAAEASGHARGLAEGPAPGHMFAVFLAPEASLAGAVTLKDTPVAGAYVSARAEGGFAKPHVTVTDDHGRFRFDRLEPGRYVLSAVADDAVGSPGVPIAVGLGERRENVAIVAEPAFSIGGRIFAEGVPCDKGALWLTGGEKNQMFSASATHDGYVRVRGLTAGQYKVSVQCTGFLSLLPVEPLSILDASSAGLQWELARGLAIRGSAREADGKPATHLRVEASAPPSEGYPQPINVDGEVDPDGRFELAGLRPGTYRVKISAFHADARAVPVDSLEVVLPSAQPEAHFVLPTTGEVHGAVIDADGRGLDRTALMLSGPSGRQHVLASDEGSFVFPRVAPGDYRLVAYRLGQRLVGSFPEGEPVQVQPQSVTRINITFPTSNHRIAGSIRNQQDLPIAGAHVTLRGRSSELLLPPTRTDADGRFAFDGLAKGRYRLQAYQRGAGGSEVQVDSDREVTVTLASPEI